MEICRLIHSVCPWVRWREDGGIRNFFVSFDSIFRAGRIDERMDDKPCKGWAVKNSQIETEKPYLEARQSKAMAGQGKAGQGKDMRWLVICDPFIWGNGVNNCQCSINYPSFSLSFYIRSINFCGYWREYRKTDTIAGTGQGSSCTRASYTSSAAGASPCFSFFMFFFCKPDVMMLWCSIQYLPWIPAHLTVIRAR